MCVDIHTRISSNVIFHFLIYIFFFPCLTLTSETTKHTTILDIYIYVTQNVDNTQMYTFYKSKLSNVHNFFDLWRKKNNEACNSLNAVQPEPVPTRVLNPNASEANYKPEQLSYSRSHFCTIFFFFYWKILAYSVTYADNYFFSIFFFHIFFCIRLRTFWIFW